jgi:hypothetical protein
MASFCANAHALSGSKPMRRTRKTSILFGCQVSNQFLETIFVTKLRRTLIVDVGDSVRRVQDFRVSCAKLKQLLQRLALIVAIQLKHGTALYVFHHGTQVQNTVDQMLNAYDIEKDRRGSEPSAA